MKIILLITTTINGYIADKNGSEEQFSETSWNRFIQYAKKYKNVVWGHNTYKNVLTFENRYQKEFNNFTKIILTNQKDNISNDNLVFLNSVDEVLEYAKTNNISTLLICGGAKINTEFLIKDLIDEIILSINPILISEGIPMLNSIIDLSKEYNIEKYEKYDDVLEVTFSRNTN